MEEEAKRNPAGKERARDYKFRKCRPYDWPGGFRIQSLQMWRCQHRPSFARSTATVGGRSRPQAGFIDQRGGSSGFLSGFFVHSAVRTRLCDWEEESSSEYRKKTGQNYYHWMLSGVLPLAASALRPSIRACRSRPMVIDAISNAFRKVVLFLMLGGIRSPSTRHFHSTHSRPSRTARYKPSMPWSHPPVARQVKHSKESPAMKGFGGQFLHDFGSYCATHQIRVILIACIFITSLCYPALAIYSSSNSHLLRGIGSFLELDAVPEYLIQYNDDLRNIWAGHNALHVRDDAVALARCGKERTIRVERIFTHGSTPDPAAALTRRTLLDTLRLERQISDALETEHILSVLGPNGRPFIASPLLCWGNDEQTLLSDNNILATINESKNVTVARVSLARDMVLAGSSSPSYLHSSNFLALTLFFPDNDCSFDSSRKQWLDVVARLASPSTLLMQEQVAPKLLALEYTTNGVKRAPWSLVDVFLSLSYAAFAAIFWISIKRISSVHSWAGLAFAGVVELLVSTIISTSVCALFAFKVNMVPWRLFPVVILFIGAENMFRLVDAVVQTDVGLPVKERIGQGLRAAGQSNTRRLVMYHAVLGTIAVFSAAGGVIRQFCVFAEVVLVAHWLLVHTYFVAVLSIDLQRLDLDELLQSSNTVVKPPKSPAPRSPKNLSGQSLATYILRTLRSIMGTRTVKRNITLFLILAMVGTLWYTSCPVAPKLIDKIDKKRRAAGLHARSPRPPSASQADNDAAFQLWKLLNPQEDALLHLRIEAPIYVTFQSSPHGAAQPQMQDRDHGVGVTLLSEDDTPRFSVQSIWSTTKIVVLPIAITEALLYLLLLYLLKDADRLEEEREKMENADRDGAKEMKDRDPRQASANFVDANITFSTLPRAFETDVELVSASKDGGVVVALSAMNELCFWRRDMPGFTTLDLTTIFSDDADPSTSTTVAAHVTSLAVAPNGGLCAVGLSNGAVAIWPLGFAAPTAQAKFYLYDSDGPKTAVTDLVFYAPGSATSTPFGTPVISSPAALLAMHENGLVAKWSLLPGERVSYLSPSSIADLKKSLIVRVGDDQAILAFCLDDGTLELSNIDRDRPVVGADCTIQAGNPKDVVTLVDACYLKLEGGRRLVVCATTEHGVTSLWDASTCDCIRVLNNTFRGITQLRLTALPTSPCTQCGKLPVDSFSLSFSLFYTLQVWRFFLGSQEGAERCACPAHQPSSSLSGPSALDNLVVGGHRWRCGKSATASSRPCKKVLAAANHRSGGSTSASAFPVSAHGFQGLHSRRTSGEADKECECAYEAAMAAGGRIVPGHNFSDLLDVVDEVGPWPPPVMVEEALWLNLVAVRVMNAPIERGSWGVLSNGSLVGMRKRRRPDTTRRGAKASPVDIPEEKERWVLPRAVQERWEVWTLDQTSQNARVVSSPLTSFRPMSALTANSTATRSPPTVPASLFGKRDGISVEEYPSLPFTRIGPLIADRGICLVGLGNVVGYLDCEAFVGRAPPPGARRPSAHPGGLEGFAATNFKKDL